MHRTATHCLRLYLGDALPCVCTYCGCIVTRQRVTVNGKGPHECAALPRLIRSLAFAIAARMALAATLFVQQRHILAFGTDFA